MTLPYIMAKDAITVMVNGTATTVREGQANFVALRDAIRAREWDRVPDLATPAKAIETFATGRVTVNNGEVLLDGEVIHNAVARRILDMVSEGFDADPLMRFLERLMQNPSRTAVSELYLWLEGTELPITEDGCFMAYKKVNDSYRDFYSGQVLNKPAELFTDEDRVYIKKPRGSVTTEVVDGVTTLSMPRNAVDDNRDRTCSQGLHFCSLSYLPAYYGGSGRVLLVKIDPADVVSIPSDYDNAKGRTWRYQIVGEHTAGEQTEAYNTSVASADGTAKHKAAAEPKPDTWVMGVNFGTEERAGMVRDLVQKVAAASGGANRSEEQGRVDGFDDAWSNVMPTFHRYTGSHMREAVAYSQSYFEGYDRCRGHAPQVQVAVAQPQTSADQFHPANDAQRAEVMRVLAVPVTGTEMLHGREDGRWDGTGDGESDKVNGRLYTLSAAERGGRGYRRAYVEHYTKAYNRSY